ncbi:MAG: hypothetical protein KDI53_17635, partial [Candidatus Accumulibacter sp.]|nr:hypothetical protein [Accumulibacter sp.]
AGRTGADDDHVKCLCHVALASSSGCLWLVAARPFADRAPFIVRVGGRAMAAADYAGQFADRFVVAFAHHCRASVNGAEKTTRPYPTRLCLPGKRHRR